MNVTEALQEHVFFENLNDSTLENISKFFTLKNVPTNKYIFHQNQYPQNIFFLCLGFIKIFSIIPKRDQIHSFAVSDEILIPDSIFTSEKYYANAIAKEPTLVLECSIRNFINLLKENPDILTTFNQETSNKITSQKNHLKLFISKEKVDKKIKQAILDFAEQTNATRKNNCIFIKKIISYKEFANYTGIAEATISRHLNSLKHSKIIIEQLEPSYCLTIHLDKLL